MVLPACETNNIKNHRRDMLVSSRFHGALIVCLFVCFFVCYVSEITMKGN